MTYIFSFQCQKPFTDGLKSLHPQIRMKHKIDRDYNVYGDKHYISSDESIDDDVGKTIDYIIASRGKIISEYEFYTRMEQMRTEHKQKFDKEKLQALNSSK